MPAYWLEKAAKNGNAEAQYKLGMMLRTGNGVPKNEADATMWIKKAADNGYRDAKEYLQKK